MALTIRLYFPCNPKVALFSDYQTVSITYSSVKTACLRTSNLLWNIIHEYLLNVNNTVYSVTVLYSIFSFIMLNYIGFLNIHVIFVRIIDYFSKYVKITV